MDIEEFAKQFESRMKEVNEFIQGDEVKTIMGVESVNHYKESFANEGFTDKTLEKWDNVKRRDKESEWYGFSLGSNVQRPEKLDENGKKIKKVSKAKATNFSPASAGRKILSGETKELQQSTNYTYIADGVRITNATPYAAVHQFGEMAKIFGKKEFTMKDRPFIGPSVVMVDNIKTKIVSEIKKKLT